MLGEVRMAALNEFLSDYDSGRVASRYVTGALPHLPFDDDSFDLALCSHFLFLYSDAVSAEDHVRAVRDLARVSREVRVFPLLDMAGNPSRHVPRVIEELGGDGLRVRVEPVAYEFQVGGNQMMRITRSADAAV
jgi:ubiquinone/menaquinone biosynthesis C-methylase UbiE